MSESIETILAPNRIAGVISQISPALNPLSSLWGWAVGGSNRLDWGGRDFSYDVFDNTKSIAIASEPGSPRTQTSPQKVGQVKGTFPRTAEQIPMPLEKLTNARGIGKESGTLDKMGTEYIIRQEKYIGQRINNVVEFQTAAMLRGQYYYEQIGGKLIQRWDDTGNLQKIDFQIPDGNKGQLPMLGSGTEILDKPWNVGTTVADMADIPNQCMGVNTAFLATHGFPLKKVLVNSTIWNLVINNAFVIQQAGTSYKPFDVIEQTADGLFVAVLRALPWLTWHIMDNGLEVGAPNSAVFEKSLEDDHAYFIPTPSSEIARYGEGSEPVVHKNTGATAEQMGSYFWSYVEDNPATRMLATVHNGLPWLQVPRAIANGTVNFTP